MNSIIIKDNTLINASYSMTLAEQRLVLLAIVAARESGLSVHDKHQLLVTADRYAKQFNVARQTAYEALKDACENLFERRFSFEERNGKVKRVKSRWVSRVAYIEEQAEVEIVFADDVLPLITALESRFTQYDLEQISGLTSGYAVRLYELLMSWRSTGKTPVIELGGLRGKLGVLGGEYDRMSDFKRRVLDSALEQINTHTDIKASYEQHKAGRVITGFSFAFKVKGDKSKPKQPDKPKTGVTLGTEEEQMELPQEPAVMPLHEINSRIASAKQLAALVGATVETYLTERDRQAITHHKIKI